MRVSRCTANSETDFENFVEALSHNYTLTQLGYCCMRCCCCCCCCFWKFFAFLELRAIADAIDDRIPHVAKARDILQRNTAIQWKLGSNLRGDAAVNSLSSKCPACIVHAVIVDACIAMASLMIPNYVMLEIIDRLPFYVFASHLKKIRLIESVNKSIKKLKNLVE